MTFLLGGDLPVHRIGFGALRLAGDLGPPADIGAAAAVLRRALDLGVTLIDTADSYGLGANEELIAATLRPYPRDLVIATKAGQTRPGPGEWVPLGRPEYLRQQAALSLRRLGVDRIDLFQLHRVDPKVPLAEQAGALARLKADGWVRHVGLSEVGVEQIEAFRREVDIVSVQNLYHAGDRRHDDVVEYCTREGIAFIPWLPLGGGPSRRRLPEAVDKAAADLGATPAQVALAWLLRRSPVILPIPGTSSLAHLAENMAAASLRLPPDVLPGGETPVAPRGHDAGG